MDIVNKSRTMNKIGIYPLVSLQLLKSVSDLEDLTTVPWNNIWIWIPPPNSKSVNFPIQLSSGLIVINLGGALTAGIVCSVHIWDLDQEDIRCKVLEEVCSWRLVGTWILIIQLIKQLVGWCVHCAWVMRGNVLKQALIGMKSAARGLFSYSNEIMSKYWRMNLTVFGECDQKE